MIWATSITDASFCPQSRAGAWAAWIRVDGVRETIKRHGLFSQPPENVNYAEMMAALNGVWLSARAGAQAVMIQTDSMSAVAAAEGRHRLYSEWWREQMVAAGISHIILKPRHVKGHTAIKDARSYVNRWCDAKALQLMRKSR